MNPKLNDAYQSKLILLSQTLGPERLKFDEKLSYHTFSKVGGPAQAFYIATSQSELVNVLDLAHQLKIPIFIFGSGTKIVISEKGMNGLIIKNRTGSIKISGIKGKVKRDGLGVEEALIEVDSGVSIKKLNEFLQKQHLTRFQGVSSEHATIGGAIFIDLHLKDLAGDIKVWDKGAIFNIKATSLNRAEQIVLSCILRVKASR